MARSGRCAQRLRRTHPIKNPNSRSPPQWRHCREHFTKPFTSGARMQRFRVRFGAGRHKSASPQALAVAASRSALRWSNRHPVCGPPGRFTYRVARGGLAPSSVRRAALRDVVALVPAMEPGTGRADARRRSRSPGASVAGQSGRLSDAGQRFFHARAAHALFGWKENCDAAVGPRRPGGAALREAAPHPLRRFHCQGRPPTRPDRCGKRGELGADSPRTMPEQPAVISSAAASPHDRAASRSGAAPTTPRRSRSVCRRSARSPALLDG